MSAAKGTYLLATHCARAMSWNAGPTRGHLIFFGDWAADETPYLDYLPYLTGKAAVHFMTRGLRAGAGVTGHPRQRDPAGPHREAARHERPSLGDRHGADATVARIVRRKTSPS